jgi:hypothetical protein
MKSYRSTKVTQWRGLPKEPPAVKIQDGYLYVSWNGATEVAYWALEATADEVSSRAGDLRSRREDEKYEAVDIVPKQGFEGAFDLMGLAAEKGYTHFRVAALDVKHNVLRYSTPREAAADVSKSSYLAVLFKLFLVIGFLVGARFAFQHFRSTGHLRSWNSPGQQYTLLSSPIPSPSWMKWHESPSSARRDVEPSSVREWFHLKWNSAVSRPQ